MKKLIGSAVLAATLFGSVASASGIDSTGAYVGIDRVEVQDGAFKENGTGLTVGIEGINAYDNGFAWGIGAGLSYVELDLGVNGSTPMYTFDMDLKLGYVPVSNLFIYALGGGVAQYIDYNYDPVDSYGFEYGAGIEYKVLENMAVNLEHKVSKLDGKGNVRDLDYDYDKTSFNIKYLF